VALVHVKHRETARVILADRAGRVFLLLTHFDPEVGLKPRWLSPGGGIDGREEISAAARRELFEETGLIANSAQIGDQIWQTAGEWLWADGKSFHSFVDHFFLLVVDGFDAGQLDKSGWTKDEHRDVLEYRMFGVDELSNLENLVGPPKLVEFLQSQVFADLIAQTRVHSVEALRADKP
jgi:8-oxo-dGTP pyrophosphatase MutT (NUDIX family)